MYPDFQNLRVTLMPRLPVWYKFDLWGCWSDELPCVRATTQKERSTRLRLFSLKEETKAVQSTEDQGSGWVSTGVDRLLSFCCFAPERRHR
eukprot:7376323-Prymnesium_polylepis.1